MKKFYLIVLSALLLAAPSYGTDITYVDKVVGGTFSAADANEIKNAVNSKQDSATAVPYPGVGIPLSTGSAWGTSYSLTTLAAALDGEAWTFTGPVNLAGASSVIMGQPAFDGSTTGDGIVTSFSVTNPTTISKSIALGDFNMRIPAATAVNTNGTIPYDFCIAASDETTALTTGVVKRTFRVPRAITLTAIRASVATAPTGAALSIDVNDSGTTVFSTALTIDATEKTSVSAAVPAVISDTALADDAEITIDIDQVGSTVAGAGLKVCFIGY